MGLVVITTIPASAASGTGTTVFDIVYASTGISTTPPCGEFTAADFNGSVAGVALSDGQVSATSGGVTATYTGPIDFDITATQTYYAGPEGTHGTDNTCATATAGSTVTMTATVNGTGLLGDVTCASDAGTFSRTGPTNTTFTWTPSCTVVDTTSGVSKTENVTFTVTGVQQACNGGPPTSCKFAGTYAVT